MKFDELINDSGSYLSFEQIVEPRTKEVRLRIIVNKAKNPTDLLIFPHADSKATTLQLDFPNYVTYSVIYDEFTRKDENELYQGDAFRIYHKSELLDSIKQKSILPDEKLKHFSLACIEHKVDILSYNEPIISKVLDQNSLKE